MTETAGAGARDRLVAAAVRLLAEEGPASLQARRLAREVEASTMAVYHYFGGMPQLLAAVLDDGFLRLDARLARVPVTDDPVADIGRLAVAYREVALENPHLYDLMFGLSAPAGHHPQEHDTGGAPCPSRRAFGHLVDAAGRAIRAGRIRDQQPSDVAAQLWSMLHGYVTLEIAGHFEASEGLTQVFLPMGANLLVGLGDDPARVAESAGAVSTVLRDST